MTIAAARTELLAVVGMIADLAELFAAAAPED